MRFIIQAISDPIDNKRRAQQLIRAMKEAGIKPTAEGPNSFDVQFPATFNRRSVHDFIEFVNPRAVVLQENDVPVITGPDPVARQIFRDGLKAGSLNAEVLAPQSNTDEGWPDQIQETLSQWDNQVWSTPMTNEQFDAYKQPEPESFLKPRAQEKSLVEQLRGEGEEYSMDMDQLREMADRELRGGR